jgi:UDP-glucose 4-epimerase
MNTHSNQLNNAVFVTGGAGFIGSHVCEALLAHGITPIVIDNLSTGNWNNLAFDHHHRIERIQASLLEYELLPEVLNRVTGVIHLAAQVSPSLSIQQPLLSLQENTATFIGLLEAVRTVNPGLPVVYASSAAVYGDQQGSPCSEDATVSPPQPTSHYGLEKLSLEQYARLYTHLYGMHLTGLRFFNVFGERQCPSSQYSGVISTFMQAATRHHNITIYGDGEQTRDFIYVKDVVTALLNALHAPKNACYNVATGTTINLLELYQTIETLFNIRFNVTHEPARLGDIRFSSALNAAGLSQGILPQECISLQKGLELMRHYETTHKLEATV